MRTWAETHRQWLQRFLGIPGGLPSRDTLYRTLSRFDPAAFQKAFLKWLKGLRKSVCNMIAIDGKTLRDSQSGGVKPSHIVSVWASDQHFTLGQTTVDQKSDQITAIRALLFAVKGNQENLYKELKAEFEKAMSLDRPPKHLSTHEVASEQKKPHGRDEKRSSYTLPAPKSLTQSGAWKGLRSIGLTITYRSDDPNDWNNGEVRYYIMSFGSDAVRFANAVRQHWGIENSLHWVIDIAFRENESRIRKGYCGENVSWLRQLAVTLIKPNTKRKCSNRQKRLRTEYDFEFLLEIQNTIPTVN